MPWKSAPLKYEFKTKVRWKNWRSQRRNQEDTKEAMLGGVVIIVWSAGSAILGGWDIMLKMLVYAMIADYLTGLLRAIRRGKINSEFMYWWGIRKSVILLVVGLAVMESSLRQSGMEVKANNLFGRRWQASNRASKRVRTDPEYPKSTSQWSKSTDSQSTKLIRLTTLRIKKYQHWSWRTGSAKQD